MRPRSHSKLITAFRRLVKADLKSAKLASGSIEKQRALLLERKAEIVAKQQNWIDRNTWLLAEYCRPNLPAKYVPKNIKFVLCEQQWQHDLWRIVKLSHWSMPPNEYVGRRKRILVFDGDYLLGLVGLASCVWGLTARDKWIGWDVEQKARRIGYVVDAYVLGAIPPYNGQYRGSKLIAYLMASEEFREIWRNNYGYSPAAIVTTTLFGHSAVLNRTKHRDQRLWQQLGYTRGFGTMHFSRTTVDTARDVISAFKVPVPDRLNSGPNWKLRLMRTAIETAGLRAEKYLEHGYKRGVHVLPHARNAQEFLSGKTERLLLHHTPMDALMESWERSVYGPNGTAH
jgi:Domain of unknown function (DUF4338)